MIIRKSMKYRFIKTVLHFIIFSILVISLVLLENVASSLPREVYYLLAGVLLILSIIELFMMPMQFIWNVYEIKFEKDQMIIKDIFFGKILLYNKGLVDLVERDSKLLLDRLLQQKDCFDVFTISKTFTFYRRDFDAYDALLKEMKRRVKEQNEKV